MAKASFFANDIKVRRKGEYLVLEARKKCQHGTVFDEVFLTLPGQLESLFTVIAENEHPLHSQDNINNSDSLAQRFKRFSGNN
jgi:hypothetical protein